MRNVPKSLWAFAAYTVTAAAPALGQERALEVFEREPAVMCSSQNVMQLTMAVMDREMFLVADKFKNEFSADRRFREDDLPSFIIGGMRITLNQRTDELALRGSNFVSMEKVIPDGVESVSLRPNVKGELEIKYDKTPRAGDLPHPPPSPMMGNTPLFKETAMGMMKEARDLLTRTCEAAKKAGRLGPDEDVRKEIADRARQGLGPLDYTFYSTDRLAGTPPKLDYTNPVLRPFLVGFSKLYDAVMPR